MLTSRAPIAATVLILALTGCGSTVQPGTQTASGGQVGGPAAGTSTGGLGAPTSGGQGAPGTGSVIGTTGGAGTTGGGPTGAGATGSSATGGATGTTSAGAATAVPSSTQAKTGPLKLGVLDASSPAAAASATGAGNPAGVDPVAITRGFIRYYNDHGGMAGRKLEPIEYTINPTSSSYESDLSAACAKFTQDNHVTVVVSQTGNIFSGNYESCLAKKGVTNLEVGNGAPDSQDVRSFPQLFTTASPTVDRRIEAQLRGLTKKGTLGRQSKLGVIVEDCPQGKRAHGRTLVPLARSLGLTVVSRDVDCVTGFSDAGAFFSQVGSAVLPFNSAGVTHVMFVTSFEVAALQAFENQAQTQTYKPTYVLSSLALTAANAGQYSADSLERMTGVGWIPVVDTTGVPRTAATKRCDAVAKEVGISPQTQADEAFIYQICDLFAVLNASLIAARGHDEASLLPAGVATAMKSFESAYVLGGRLRLSRDQHDAPPVFSVFAYQQQCACFRYSTTPTDLA